MNKYEEIKNKHQKRVNEFPIGFAFSNQQFKEMMEKWGLKETDIDKILTIGAGGFIRKSDLNEYNRMWKEIRKEHNDLMEQDKTGDGYIKDMFVYELENHEYSYTRELKDTLDYLELTYTQVMKNPALKHGLELAQKEILNNEKERYFKEDYDL